jgi:hypothetical protein
VSSLSVYLSGQLCNGESEERRCVTEGRQHERMYGGVKEENEMRWLPRGDYLASTIRAACIRARAWRRRLESRLVGKALGYVNRLLDALIICADRAYSTDICSFLLATRIATPNSSVSSPAHRFTYSLQIYTSTNIMCLWYTSRHPSVLRFQYRQRA